MKVQKNLIAIAVKENGELWGGHFGTAPFFLIYNYNAGLIEKRENPFGAGQGKHEHHDNPKLIVELLKDCKVFIAKRMGTESKKKLVETQGVIPFITKKDDPQLALCEYLKFEE